MHSFAGGSDGSDPIADLTPVGTTFYGTTSAGGASNHGTVFSITKSGSKTVLYSFAGGTDGYRPQADLVNVDGTLYGTTSSGGSGCGPSGGCGTVFSITTSGMETVLYRFAGGPSDGTAPVAGLISVSGTLYGTTAGGGAHGNGTVFKVTTAGKEKVLYSFAGGTDGANPCATLTNVNGTLYGTTRQGGANDFGTVFQVTTSGVESVIHRFGGGTDGKEPLASLLNVNGTLYGTTYFGGANSEGSVFSVTTSGTESVLYSFGGSSGDGDFPEAGLINLNGTLFGTTYQGGSRNRGTMFSVTTSGTESVLYSFGGNPDGQNPHAGLTADINGTLYGTTAGGGANNQGTVFSIAYHPPTETVLHSFGGSGDGSTPYGPLLGVSGTLYGTTLSGGASSSGTVYSITHSGTESVLHAFAGSPDGQNPYAGLTNVNGTLYGTTVIGGAYNGGAVYSITTSGTESVLQSFYPGSDGAAPIASLISYGNTLYDTTSTGGVYNAGTAFSMTTSGAETVLHSFGGAGDGTDPVAPLLDVGAGQDTLYGTTMSGGANSCGTVFAVSKSSGKETVLHSFSGSPDGCAPQYGALITLNGTMYGTTSSGGNSGCASDEGCGTVFSITPSGTETVLHSFTGGTDGTAPYGGLAVINGVLYGTTRNGGAYNQGTIFTISPTPPSNYAVIWAFGNQLDGAHPQSDPIVVGGTLYGTTTQGGANNQGAVFSLLP
ncbi:MAG: choice-of-anchor tandem repeat GloVer-containing protein [Candidatus Tumulicola sp.]